MPATREEHITYTRNELDNYPYYINVIEELKNDGIKSYIDIGANIGEFCNVLFNKIPSLTEAYLFEPEIENFTFMESNLKHKKLSLFNVAIGYDLKNGVLVPHGSANVGGFMVIDSESATNARQITIKTLEELNLPLVDLVKIDIEGGEFNVIENSTYLQNIKWVEIEFHLSEADSKNKAAVRYVEKHFPNHSMIVIEPVFYSRILLKRN
jgi:FkbM family methyltransferase